MESAAIPVGNRNFYGQVVEQVIHQPEDWRFDPQLDQSIYHIPSVPINFKKVTTHDVTLSTCQSNSWSNSCSPAKNEIQHPKSFDMPMLGFV